MKLFPVEMRYIRDGISHVAVRDFMAKVIIRQAMGVALGIRRSCCNGYGRLVHQGIGSAGKPERNNYRLLAP
jgi:hypothetical protein